jgi:hypothetical protein
MPCCQGFTLEIDGGPVVNDARGPMVSLRQAWASQNFDRLRRAQRDRTWDRAGTGGEPICKSCAVTKMPTRLEVPKRLELPVRN